MNQQYKPQLSNYIMQLGKESLDIDCKTVSDKIQTFIKSKAKQFKRDGVIIALSGGSDSTTVAALAVKAVGKENVLGLLMPEKEGTKEFYKQINRRDKLAGLLIDMYGIRECDIEWIWLKELLSGVTIGMNAMDTENTKGD